MEREGGGHTERERPGGGGEGVVCLAHGIKEILFVSSQRFSLIVHLLLRRILGSGVIFCSSMMSNVPGDCSTMPSIPNKYQPVSIM